MTLQERLRSRRPEILSAAERYGARDVRVFGSVVRGAEVLDSDVDFLVTLEPGRTLLDAGGLQVELEALLGCRVDLILDGNLTGHTGERIARTARPLAGIQLRRPGQSSAACP